MRIGFDAKRAYFNQTGLGNYSRTLLSALVQQHPSHEYFLYCPKKPNGQFDLHDKANVSLRLPTSLSGKLLPSIWRSLGMSGALTADELDIFHGLSHELPAGIRKTNIRTLVTMHDLIYLRYPEYFPAPDRFIYDKKFRRACQVADRILAVSEQTKQDIMEFYGTPAKKIRVLYQACRPVFRQTASDEDLAQLNQKHQLPAEYLLYVGAVTARKNLLGLAQALHTASIRTHLVVVGSGGSYLQQVKSFLAEKKMEARVHFLQDVGDSELPGIYQQARALVYPSFFEGFGIPLIEALFSKTPVITSNVSALPEAGGPDSIYVEPGDTEALAEAIKTVLTDQSKVEQMVVKGLDYAQRFREAPLADELMQIYNEVNS